jgi:hypothetical protein
VRTAAEAVDQLRVRLRLIAGGREFLTLAQVCHELLTSRGTYYRMVAAGTWPIPAIQPRISGAPKFHVDDVALFLRQSAACHADERLRLVRGGR